MNPSSSTGSAPKKRSPTAPSKASTTRFEWLPDDPTAFAPMRPWKSRCITTWEDCRSQNQPTDSAEEAHFPGFVMESLDSGERADHHGGGLRSARPRRILRSHRHHPRCDSESHLSDP